MRPTREIPKAPSSTQSQTKPLSCPTQEPETAATNCCEPQPAPALPVQCGSEAAPSHFWRHQPIRPAIPGQGKESHAADFPYVDKQSRRNYLRARIAPSNKPAPAETAITRHGFSLT